MGTFLMICGFTLGGVFLMLFVVECVAEARRACTKASKARDEILALRDDHRDRMERIEARQRLLLGSIERFEETHTELSANFNRVDRAARLWDTMVGTLKMDQDDRDEFEEWQQEKFLAWMEERSKRVPPTEALTEGVLPTKQTPNFNTGGIH